MIQDWVKLAVAAPDHQVIPRLLARRGRPTTANLIAKVQVLPPSTTPRDSTSGSSRRPTRKAVSRAIRQGENTISVTGNVLRDYNTDLFPILEVRHERQRCCRSSR